MGVQGLALLALCVVRGAGTEPRNASHALAAGRRRLNDQYAQIAKLVAGDAAAGDAFGGSVAIDGDTVVVGSPCDDDDGSCSGSVYVLRTTDGGATYGQVAKLTANALAIWHSLAVLMRL